MKKMNWAGAWKRAAHKLNRKYQVAERQRILAEYEARKWRRRYGVIGVALLQAGFAPTTDRMEIPKEYADTLLPENNREYPVYHRPDETDVYR